MWLARVEVAPNTQGELVEGTHYNIYRVEILGRRTRIAR
jgi:hypothetical protein